MVDVSANAYGHGLCEIGVTVLRNGVGLLAVESLEEGLELRRGAVDEPILVMGTIPQADVSDAIQNELMVSITDLEQARLLARTARSLKRTARVHLKVDAESAGYGLELDSVVPLVRELIRLDFIEITGLDVQSPGTGITQNVMDNFAALVKSLHAAGLVIPHISSEGKGALSSQINVVLVGGCLYGFASNSAATCPSEVRPVLTWKSSVLQVNEAAGSRRLAVIGAGYGGGFRNTSSGTGYVLLHGSRVPLVGPIEVGHCTVDISRLGEVFPGDEAIMIGTQGSEVITAEEVAKRWGCSALEVTTSIPPVIPRVLTETQ
jgi:alanine racemase